MYVSITGHDAIGVINRDKRTLVEVWSVAKTGGQNTPLTLDERDHRLFTVIRKPGKFLALDTNTGRVIFSVPTVSHADDLTFRPADQEDLRRRGRRARRFSAN